MTDITDSDMSTSDSQVSDSALLNAVAPDAHRDHDECSITDDIKSDREEVVSSLVNADALPQGDVAKDIVVQRNCQCGTVDGVCRCDFKETNNKTFIYAVGVLTPIFPNEGLLNTFESVARKLGVSEYDYFNVFSVFDNNEKTYPNFYIAEQVDWVLTIDYKSCYLVKPRSRVELMGFINATKKPENSLQEVYSTIVGVLGEPSKTNEGMLATVLCNHIYSQTLSELHNKIQGLNDVATTAIQDVLKQLEFKPNNGETDFNRAKNYLAFQYPDIYSMTHSFEKKSSTNNVGGSSENISYFLEDISSSYSDLMASHTIVDIILKYKSKKNKSERYYYCSVDVTNQFPFINTPLQSFMPLTAMSD